MAVKETVINVQKPLKKRRSFFADLLIRLVKEKPVGTFGGAIVLIMLFAGIFSSFLAPYDPLAPHPGEFLQAPSPKYILGTDNLGRDLFSRILAGARTSMIVGLASPALSVMISLLIGGVSGFLGGKFDMIVQRLVDAWMCFPELIILLSVMAFVGQGLLQVVLVLGISGGIGGSRTMRGAVIGIKENVYVDAASAIGSQVPRTLMKHILPNIMPVVIIIFTTRMAGAILAEASISFLGFGIPPPNPTWGGMLSGSGRRYMLQAPWLVLWPGMALSVAVYGINMLGDALRDLLDPRLRGGIGRYEGGKVKKAQAKMKATRQE
ncbi:MAG: ABC transporter permease [Dehalococcoidia bacterium]|nr:ABC transporter permease [Dehalococcoidia bacterium]